MMPHRKDLRDRLLAAQEHDEHLKVNYEQEIRDMVNHRLSGTVKGLLVGLVGLCLFAIGVTAINFKRIGPELGIPGLAFELAIAGCLSWIVWRGSLNRTAHGFILAGAVGFFSVCAAGFFADAMRDVPADERPLEGTMVVIIALVLGWLPMLLVTFSHYHNRTREKLLEIQYQLAELAEEIRRRQ